MNADYRGQLVSRAVDLVQLFPTAAYAKNGADIRLAVDAVEDMFRLPDLTHVVIVAGDSDYIPLAQRCKRLGRYVVGVGVAGSTSRALAAACDEFVIYDALPGITPAEAPQAGHHRTHGGRTRGTSGVRQRAGRAGLAAHQAARGGRSRFRGPAGAGDQAPGPGAAARPGKRRRGLAAQLRGEEPDEAHGPVVQRAGTRLPVLLGLRESTGRRR